MEQVNIQAIGTFIDKNYNLIINGLNLSDKSINFLLNYSIINNICKYPIKVSKIVSFNKYYDYDHDTQPIETYIPVIDINCTPIKIVSSINPYSLENIYNIHINGYQIISSSSENYYHIIIKTFNNLIKSFNFDAVFYVDFVNIDKVNKIGFYINTEYHINSEIKTYFQQAFDYLKKECNLYFDKNKSYLFLDTFHNEIIIYNNNLIYRFTNLNIDKFDPLLQRYVPSTINCFEEFIINELITKQLIESNYDDIPEDISDDEEEDYDY